ncbi:anaphase-promoting complex subunit CDC26-like [Diadema antillarum]|uniref:anaphase-promoting complex subunit CDC26-like n=1 Tax=Diadema antillarum TaxID=105358 RepID=UPI003A89DA35
MIKRGPTRIVLKLEDLEEFDNIKKELEQKRRVEQVVGLSPTEKGAQSNTSNGAAAGQETVVPAGEIADPRARDERIRARIGFDPRPVPTTSHRIGEFRGSES